MVTDHKEGVFRNVVHCRGVFRINEGHIPVGSGSGQAVFIFVQVLCQGGDQSGVDIFPPVLADNETAQILTKPCKAVGMQCRYGLCHGKNPGRGKILSPPLGVRVKGGEGIQLVAEELRPDGAFSAGGVDVHNAAPDGKLAHALHHGGAVVARGSEAGSKFLQRVFLSNLQGESGSFHYGGGHGPQTQGFPGENLNGRFSQGKRIELPDPFLLPGPGNGGRVIEGQLPPGKNGDSYAQEVLQVLLKTPGGNVVLAYNDQGALCVLTQARNQVAAVDLTDAGDRGCPIVLQSFQEAAVFSNGVKQMNKLFHKVPQGCANSFYAGRTIKRAFLSTPQSGKGTKPLPVLCVKDY